MALYRDESGNLVDDQAPPKPKGLTGSPGATANQQIQGGITAGDGFSLHGIDSPGPPSGDMYDGGGRAAPEGRTYYGEPQRDDPQPQAQSMGIGADASAGRAYYGEPQRGDRSSQVQQFAQQDSMRGAQAPPPPASSAPVGGNYLGGQSQPNYLGGSSFGQSPQPANPAQASPLTGLGNLGGMAQQKPAPTAMPQQNIGMPQPQSSPTGMPQQPRRPQQRPGMGQPPAQAAGMGALSAQPRKQQPL